MSLYRGGFKSKEDVIDNFQLGEHQSNGIEIIYAEYDNHDYEADAFVLYKKDGKLYEVYGSHCSCFDLENQWEPEIVSIDALKKRSKLSKEAIEAAEKAISSDDKEKIK